MCVLTDLCSCDYLKCFAGKEQQRWDRNTLLFGLSGEDVPSGRAFNKAVTHKPNSGASVPSRPAPPRRVKRALAPPARRTSRLRAARCVSACG